ncbi:MAG: c-type cytochrome [Caldilineaceae bacterium]
MAPALNSKYWFTHRLNDLGYTGSQKSYVMLTVAAGRPSKVNSQWAQRMATWSRAYGGPLRDDQIDALANYILNWEESALEQTDEEDPWQPFQGVDTGWEGVRAAEAGITETVGISETQAVTETAGPRSPDKLFVELACVGCHDLNARQDPDVTHLVGPNLGNLWEVAGNKVPGEDATTYVHNSIVTPNAFVNEGFLANLMPQDLATKMTPEELDALVTWLLDPNRGQ